MIFTALLYKAKSNFLHTAQILFTFQIFLIDLCLGDFPELLLNHHQCYWTSSLGMKWSKANYLPGCAGISFSEFISSTFCYRSARLLLCFRISSVRPSCQKGRGGYNLQQPYFEIFRVTIFLTESIYRFAYLLNCYPSDSQKYSRYALKSQGRKVAKLPPI